jgi:uncharacterized protein (TIGR02302 family)
MSDHSALRRRLELRLRLARAALLWERAWPAAWPALCVAAGFAVLALFDLLPLLPAAAHAAVLSGFALAFAAAAAWGARAVAQGGIPDQRVARRRIESASGLLHRPIEALADRPSAPLDGAAAALWAAHQRRMNAAIRRLRVGWPAAGLARHDPWGVRSVLAILLLLAAIDAGGDWRDRLARAVQPGFDGGAATATSFDGWLTPPEYTGLAPQFLRPDHPETIRVPTGSVLLAQVHGGSALPHLVIDGKSSDFTAIDKHNFRFETPLRSGRSLTLRQDGDVLGSWPIEIVSDNPPAIAFARPPQATPHAALRLDWQATDDYGVEAAKAVIRRVGGPSAEAIELELPLPGVHLKNAAATSYHDLSPHPWAGLPVEIRLVATDALGQTGQSAPVHMILPERIFHNPVARAIIDQRKELAKDPKSAAAVAEILGDLNQRPALYGNDAVVYLALRLAADQLRRDNGKATIAAVEQLLWDTALSIEDGNLSLVERALRRIQGELQDALAKNAPDAEIDRLMSELQQALDRYMQGLAQEMQQHPNERMTPVDPSHVLTGRDLQSMLDRARELAAGGDREQARQMLSQLQNMLENLRAARPDQRQQRGAREAQQTMRGLQQLMQNQQKLLDRSFRAQRGTGQPDAGEQADEQSGERAGKQEDSGDAAEMGEEAGQQEGLRHQLGEMMRRLGEGTGDIPEPFGRAERAMHDAASALQRGRPGQAIAPQTEALDQLQQAARDFARQMQERLGKGFGDPNLGDLGATGGNPRERTDRDPFGRPMANEGTFDQSDVKIPDDNILQKSRRILDELRRRAGERSRPQLELDYLDRLLKRF